MGARAISSGENGSLWLKARLGLRGVVALGTVGAIGAFLRSEHSPVSSGGWRELDLTDGQEPAEVVDLGSVEQPDPPIEPAA